ncbi:alginate O-acetyltransferase AlgX-related protein [Candidatus Symbiobacter mobilis]|uniref:Acetyltransferase n=1 Tax=Candidatus Symbiobacter mobilis CR TaxID=946483 RepID=U5ND02_9BURK|nr:acetyltransferase [Candidatus Symbiobacter mobilis]AGX88118.1 acetyltransferase [Candidatus Symbiobacter mobilis CR]
MADASPSWLGDPPTHRGWWADAAVLLAVVCSGAAMMASLLPQISQWELPTTWDDLRTGRTTSALEKKLEQALPGRDGIIAAANSVRYLLLHGGGKQVLVGRDGWLFLRQEMQVWPTAPMERRIARIASATQWLHRQGLRTKVALVPDKARLYADSWYWAGYPDALRPRYAQALQALRAAGVDTIDLLAPLQAAARNAEVYYRTDTHWNQIGAQVAAQALADAVRNDAFSSGSMPNSLTTPTPNPTPFATTTAPTPSERPGDLIRLMGLEHAPASARPRPDIEHDTTTQALQSPAGDDLFDNAQDHAQDDLLGDYAVPYTLAGTSYSLRGNFVGHLQQALSSPVLNTATDGAGVWRALADYVHDDAFRSAPAQMLLWEIPERLLCAPADDAEQRDWERLGITPL